MRMEHQDAPQTIEEINVGDRHIYNKIMLIIYTLRTARNNPEICKSSA